MTRLSELAVAITEKSLETVKQLLEDKKWQETSHSTIGYELLVGVEEAVCTRKDGEKKIFKANAVRFSTLCKTAEISIPVSFVALREVLGCVTESDQVFKQALSIWGTLLDAGVDLEWRSAAPGVLLCNIDLLDWKVCAPSFRGQRSGFRSIPDIRTLFVEEWMRSMSFMFEVKQQRRIRLIFRLIDDPRERQRQLHPRLRIEQAETYHNMFEPANQVGISHGLCPAFL